MSRYKEIASQVFEYRTKATVYGVFADLVKPQHQAIMPYQQFGQRGMCHLRILQQEKESIVIATETAVNPGKSVTNAAEDIATQAVQQFQLDPTTTRFIEHYTKESYEGSEEGHFEVTFTWQEQEATNPQWKPLQPHEIAALTDVE